MTRLTPPRHVAPVLICCLIGLAAAAVEVPNADFEAGSGVPDGWTLSGGEGRWEAGAEPHGHYIEVTGTGEASTSNFWRSTELSLETNQVYRLRFDGRRTEGSSGLPITGPVFANTDLPSITDTWQRYTTIFVTPDELPAWDRWIRFGQWEVKGGVAYDNIALGRVTPLHRRRGSLVLGEGERIQENEYAFRAPLGLDHGGYARPLLSHRCGFNTHRWVFHGANSEVVYRHELGGLRQTSAEVEIAVGYHVGGTLYVYAFRPGEGAVLVGTLDAAGTANFAVPESLLPANAITIRLAAAPAESGEGVEATQSSAPGVFQVHAYTYRARLDQSPGNLSGSTAYVGEAASDPRLRAQLLTLGEMRPGGDNTALLNLKNLSDESIALEPALTLSKDDGGTPKVFKVPPVTIAPGPERALRIPYQVRKTGVLNVRLSFGEQTPLALETGFHVPAYYDVSYGETLPGSTDAVGLWWASSGWKVWPDRPMPTATGPAVELRLARNEVEAAQFVLRPSDPLAGLTVMPGELQGPGSARIPPADIEVLQVGYVNITQPTDATGVAGRWPDPLPPITGPLDLAAGRQQPLWVRVRTHPDTKPGIYRGEINLRATGYDAVVPLKVQVYSFALPDRMSCTTAFGLSAPRIFQYHGLKEVQDQRAVWDKYLAMCSAHHISPYDPAPLDPFAVSWPGQSLWEGGIRDRAVKHGGGASRCVLDESDAGNVSLRYQPLLPLPEEGPVEVAFWAKTQAPDHRFSATLSAYDAAGNWIYGQNLDHWETGTGDWQEVRFSRDAWPDQARQCSFTVWAAGWTESGEAQGAVWVDDVRITHGVTGTEVLAADFESQPAEEITPEIDWRAWDEAMEKAIGTYHFNAFSLPIQGMGGGTFHARVEPSLLGYAEGTPEYEAAFNAYCRTVESHLADKGWLDEAFVYWFDEPEPRDYAFVMNGFQKLRDAAPRLRGMLTKQVEEELVGGPRIWCPLTPEFGAERAAPRMALGESFWWYVCTAPKAPYTTLFIDHPGTALRVWLWQTWKRGITGTLVWEMNYWNSPTAYTDPAHPQNPYADPMSWVTGYGVAPGTRMAWGNGDGRFLYPPLTAADGRPEEPVLDGPVGSIRFDMLRDGIEDYEYLALLRRLYRKHQKALNPALRKTIETMLEVPDEISQDLTHFTHDPAPIEARRDAVARTIELLDRLR